MENEVFLASKELLEILSSSSPAVTASDPFDDALIIIGESEKQCSIKRIKLNKFNIEVLISLPKNECIEIVKSGIGKRLIIPLIFGESFISEIVEIELHDSYNVKIMSSIVHS